MKVQDCMTREVRLIKPDQTILEAAQLMAEMDAGAVPVGEDDQLIGMITDRDIAIRAVAKGLGLDTLVRDVMSRDIKYCFEDESVEHVAQNMGEIQMRRLPVMDRKRRLVGIVSLGDLAQKGSGAAKVIGEALSDVSRHNGLHAAH
jgi:CBS domain-containing protein